MWLPAFTIFLKGSLDVIIQLFKRIMKIYDESNAFRQIIVFISTILWKYNVYNENYFFYDFQFYRIISIIKAYLDELPSFSSDLLYLPIKNFWINFDILKASIIKPLHYFLYSMLNISLFSTFKFLLLRWIIICWQVQLCSKQKK